MPGERFKEIVDFATTESPFRSANKGWINDNVFLQWGPDKDRKTSEDFDQLAEIAFYWQPIIQIATILFVVISLATIFAFAPIYLSKGSSNLLSGFSFRNSESAPVEKMIKEVEVQKSTEDSVPAQSPMGNIIMPEISLLDSKVDNSIIKTDSISENKVDLGKSTNLYSRRTIDQRNMRNVVTATDLFQPRRN